MTKRPENRTQAVHLLESSAGQGVRDFIPKTVETTHRGERNWDIFSRLLKDRIVFLGTEINDDVANIIIAQFLFLESEDPDKEIMLYINSPGGVVTSGLAIYDTMQYVRSTVSTTCLGMAASMGAVLLAAGIKGRRMALPNARVMIHQPHGGARSQSTSGRWGPCTRDVAPRVIRSRSRPRKLATPRRSSPTSWRTRAARPRT